MPQLLLLRPASCFLCQKAHTRRERSDAVLLVRGRGLTASGTRGSCARSLGLRSARLNRPARAAGDLPIEGFKTAKARDRGAADEPRPQAGQRVNHGLGAFSRAVLDELAGRTARGKWRTIDFPRVPDRVSSGNGLGVVLLGVGKKSVLTNHRTQLSNAEPCRSRGRFSVAGFPSARAQPAGTWKRSNGSSSFGADLYAGRLRNFPRALDPRAS